MTCDITYLTLGDGKCMSQMESSIHVGIWKCADKLLTATRKNKH